jgi:hypothetical protein
MSELTGERGDEPLQYKLDNLDLLIVLEIKHVCNGKKVLS